MRKDFLQNTGALAAIFSLSIIVLNMNVPLKSTTAIASDWPGGLVDTRTIVDSDLKSLAGRRDITRVNLAGAQVTDHALSLISTLPSLQELQLSGTRIRGPEMSTLANATQLTLLNLSFTDVTNSDLKVLGSLPKLDTLILTGTSITDDAFESIVKCKSLRVLHLSRTKVNGMHLVQLSGLSFLKELDLSFSDLSNVNARDLKHFNAIQKLSAEGCGVGDDLVEAIVESKTLEEIHLGDLASDRSLALLSGIRRLRGFGCASNSISEEGVKALLRLNHLANIRLHSTAISSKCIDEFKNLPRLRELSLRGVSRSDQGFKGIHLLRQLEHLDLSGCDVRDEDVDGISLAARLRYLWIKDTNVSTAGMNRLWSQGHIFQLIGPQGQVLIRTPK